MKKVIIFIVFVSSLLVGASVTMGKGLYGATDLMVTPSSTTLSPGTVGLGLNLAEDDQFFANMDLGLATDFEMGIAVYGYHDYRDKQETDVTLRGKYRFMRETATQPALTIGIEDIGADEISPYIVLTKTFQATGIRGYLGAGGGDFDGLFAGISKNFKVTGSAVKQVQLLAEADSDNLNVGTRLMLNNQTAINFGLNDMEKWVIGATFQLK